MRLYHARARTRARERTEETLHAAAWKAAVPVSACARSLDWENGRLVRSMDGPCAAHATGETPVLPVKAPQGAPAMASYTHARARDIDAWGKKKKKNI